MTHEKRLLPDAIAIALLAGTIAAFFLLACSGADGDPAPADAGTDAGAVIVSCADGATP